MKKFYFLIMLLSLTTFSFAQVPDINWEKSYGGSSYESAWDIQQTIDGGYIMAGYTHSNDGDVTDNNGNIDAWIIKMDATGSIQWQKTYGGSSDDSAHSILQLNDGSYIFAGGSQSSDGDVTNNYGLTDCWVVKLDATGNIQWQKNYGGTDNEEATCIKPTTDGGYVFSGNASSNDIDVSENNGGGDFWIVKLDATGNMQWQKCFGGTHGDFANSVIQTPNQNYVIVGETWSDNGDVVGKHAGVNNADAWIIKLNSSGNLLWQKPLGGSYSDRAHNVVVANNGNYAVVCSAQSNDYDVVGNHSIVDGYSDVWLVEINTDGNLQWQNCLGGTADEYGSSLQKTTDNGYIISGHSSSSDGDLTVNQGSTDYWIIKLDNTGNLQWQKSIGGTSPETTCSVLQTIDGNYIVAGTSTSYNGDITGNHGDSDFWVVKLQSSPLSISDVVVSEQFFLGIYPNPTTDFIQIENQENLQINSIKIFDLNGREVFNKNEKIDKKFDVSLLSKGLYMLALKTEKGIKNIKFIKE